MALWPSVSGNTINGVGEAHVRQPSPVYWHAPDATPHGPLQVWFMKRTTPLVQAARQERQAAIDLPVEALADTAVERSAEAWTQVVKAAALAASADAVGITAVQPQWVFEGYAVGSGGSSSSALRTTGTPSTRPRTKPRLPR
ncbi:MAG: hypothetical protein R2712_09115 [Vicinamibacterales bacterium]